MSKLCKTFGHKIKRHIGFDPEYWGDCLVLSCKRTGCHWQEYYSYDEMETIDE